MPKPKFTDDKLIKLYNGEDQPSLYKIAQILGVSGQAVRERAKKLGLKPRVRTKPRIPRRVHSILAYPKLIKMVDQLAKKLKTSKADVWDLAVTELHKRTMNK